MEYVNVTHLRAGDLINEAGTDHTVKSTSRRGDGLVDVTYEDGGVDVFDTRQWLWVK